VGSLVSESGFLRVLGDGEVKLLDWLSRRGYGVAWLTGFLSAVVSLGLVPDEVLVRLEGLDSLDGPSVGVVREWLDGKRVDLPVIRKDAKLIKDYVNLDNLSFDLMDTFYMVKNLLEDDGLKAKEVAPLVRVMRDIYDVLNKAVDEGKMKNKPTTMNFVSLSGDVASMVSPECKAEVDGVIQKHMRLQTLGLKDEDEVSG
jgi:hypothetical protein